VSRFVAMKIKDYLKELALDNQIQSLCLMGLVSDIKNKKIREATFDKIDKTLKEWKEINAKS
jgi:hypothetical protein